MTGDISYLKRMRTGQHPHETVTLGNGSDSFDVEVVLLSNDEMLTINEQVEERYHTERKIDADGREQIITDAKDSGKNRTLYYNRLLCYHCMRLPDDIEVKVAASEEEVGELLDLEDIQRVCEKYNEILINKAPKLEILKEDDLEALKKYLEVTPLSDLSTVLLVHLKSCHQTLLSEKCLTSNGSGSLSTKA